MRLIWLSLLWKEWCEYRWKLAALSVVILVPPFLLTAWIKADSLQVFIHILLGTLPCYGFLAGMFLGMGVAARENGVGTTPFLQSLPTPMWKTAAAKLVVASVTAVTPIVLLFAVSYTCYRTGFFFYAEDLQHVLAETHFGPMVSWTDAEWFLSCLLATVIGTLSLLWWSAALGVNRSDEIRAGAIAFLGIVAIWACAGYLNYLFGKYELRALSENLKLVAAAAPAGVWSHFGPSSLWHPVQKTALFFVIGLIGHAGVLGWFLHRFGRVSTKTGRGDGLLSKTAVAGSLKAPFRSQLTAVAWKQVRETGPLAALALPAILAMSGFAVWVTPHEQLSFSLIFLQAGASMSFFVVLVAGIGLYLDELQPGLNHFWRSRPNDFRLWFGVKYAAGLLVLVTILGIPLFLAGMSQWGEMYDPTWKELWGRTLFGVWFFVITYSLAMTAQCLARQPIYAVVFSLTAMWFGAFVFHRVFGSSPPMPVTVTAMVLSLAAVIALAWKTVEHDWGWKR